MAIFFIFLIIFDVIKLLVTAVKSHMISENPYPYYGNNNE